MYRKEITVERPETLVFVAPRRSYVLDKAIWHRIKSAVSLLPHKTTVFENAGWACLGISGTFVVAALPLLSVEQNIPAWVVPTCWIAGLAAAAVAVISLLMQRSHNRLIETGRDYCLSLLTEIEAAFEVIETEHDLGEPTSEQHRPVLQPDALEQARASIQEEPPKIESSLTPSPLPGEGQQVNTIVENPREFSLLEALNVNIDKSVLGNAHLPRE
jgi:hypothetical protein